MEKVALLDIHQFHDDSTPEEFYINSLRNHLDTRHKDIAHPHKHNFYLAVLFTNGYGTHEVDFTSYQVTPGALFFLNPGQTHHWELSENTDGYIFFHSNDLYEMHYTQNHLSQFPFYYSLYNSPMVQLQGDDYGTITSLFKTALEENARNCLFKRQKLLSLVDLIYIESSRIYLETNANAAISGPHSEVFTNFEKLIETNFREMKSPAQYASLLAVSPKHLNRITQSAAGKTASDMIQDRVLLEAKKELLLQKDNFTEIANHLGYEDYAYFSRVFKKRTGVTPSAFIAKYRKA